jgi:co-chaperonin GroES (HSP10)
MSENVQIVEGRSEFAMKRYGFYTPKPPGWKIVIETYIRKEGDQIVREDGTFSSIVMPGLVSKRDEYRNYVGLVIELGASAYKDSRYRDSGPWCKVGDWILFRRNDGLVTKYRGIPIQIIPEDSVEAVIDDPSHITMDQ